MKIDKIILYRYRRLSLNSIERLEYTPENNIQVIIGRNMSGKSSLLKELSPLPPELKKEFKDEGYKEIHISHNNSNYILLSKLENNKQIHSFKKDNVELNDGSTRKVQLELVKQYFNITPAIMDILLNKNNFTSMAPLERKKWFTDMSSIDYTYPISIYNKIKTTHRDILGGIKLSGDNIVSIESKLNNEDFINKRLEDKKVLEILKDEISNLYTNIDNSNQEDIVNRLNTDMNNLNRLLSTLDDKYDLTELRKSIDKDKIELEHISKNIEQTHKEMDILEASNKVEEEDILNKEKHELSIKIDDIFKEMKSMLDRDITDFRNTRDMYNEYAELYTNVLPYINKLAESDNYRDLESGPNLIQLTEKEYMLRDSILRLTNLIRLVSNSRDEMLKNMRQENKVTCEVCSHTWYFNYNPKTIEEYNTRLKTATEEIEEDKKKHEYLVKVLEKVEKRNKTLEHIRNMLYRTNKLRSVVKLILSETNGLVGRSSEQILSVFNKYNSLLYNWAPRQDYEDKVDLINKKLKFIEETKKMNISLEKSRLVSLENKLVELQTTFKDTTNSIAKNTNVLRSLEKIEDGYNRLKRSIYVFRSSIEQKTVEIRNHYLTELISNIKEDIQQVEKDIFDFRSSKDRISKEKELLTDYKVREKILGIIEKELSPSEGLIAKSMNSFLNIFVEEMNEVISNIWTYSLELLPCDIDSESGYDLDYKFKVKINNDEIVDDVNKLSSSAKEIVNLAYRIVFAKYMDISSIPLYLDEFGSSFDPAHRNRAYDAIDKILSSEYGQIFMVCHYETLYSTIRNIDVNILDPNNIETNYINDKDNRFKIN